ncbi:uncharacterized protein BXZ73DRAFT_93834 [Epithele typhae]|uniref:uncharacterized protein n=1 Tax=Epithele typhae TaxID=378194 RepID=UPI002007B5AE|nr:uncharacterized protein BXZ73DRAFT_93834 [Epithele typhae]KAH9910324.1 hypothetical protein BXZ73DRAFT_93834 [Epithele typhae]
MWLLSTQTGRLHYYSSVNDAPKYAILSHVWRVRADGGEDTFQDIQQYTTQCDARQRWGQHPRDLVSHKIGRFLQGAEDANFDFAWADTAASTRRAVRNVPPGDINDKNGATRKAFKTSKWFTRGWTLQEIIAPQVVIFVASDWSRLGTKHELASLVQDITHVPASVLRFEMDVADMSVAERLSWASRRETTRKEDEAYSLFGLFGLSLPTLYGEGSNALHRLRKRS